MALPIYPENVRVFIDSQDVTSWLFGTETITPTDIQNVWPDIDITPFVIEKGVHTIELTCESGVGRVEVIVQVE